MKFPFSDSLSIRAKMTLAALFPLGVVLLLATIAAFSFINAWVVDQAQNRVRQDLSAAREVLAHREESLADVIEFTAHASEVERSLSQGIGSEEAREELEAIVAREGLDFLSLANAQGEVVLRGASQDPGQNPPPPPAALPLIEKSLGGDPACGTVILEALEMDQENPGLSHRARIPVRRPVFGRQNLETRGMFLLCAAPVTNDRDVVVGSLYGSSLLNANLPLIDRIKEVVYGEAPDRGIDSGSATIFLDDLRIATTVRLQGGERALGTFVSSEVAEAVLEEKEIWLDRAKVVDEWYLTAYEPILNPQEKAIGALYVGLLERPFTELKRRASLILLGLLLVGGVLGYLLARIVSERLSRPLLRLESGALRLTRGERNIQLPVTTRDEVGELTETFNRMTAALGEKEEELQGLNRKLEDKVLERTALLEEKSLELIRAKEELMRSEKLAAIGSLAAGVAHEINNPAAIIRGNVEILLADLQQSAEGREEAEEILRQTERISTITANMLSFARKQTLHLEEVDLNALMEVVEAQVRHQVPLGSIEVRWQLDPDLPEVEADSESLRQVINNLLINALQAMEGQGILTLGSRAHVDKVEIRVSDTGPGIPEALREKIFHPFLTTKKRGTGLGLSVSYGIVQALGGTIEVESKEGEGATFRIFLPLKGRVSFPRMPGIS